VGSNPTLSVRLKNADRIRFCGLQESNALGLLISGLVRLFMFMTVGLKNQLEAPERFWFNVTPVLLDDIIVCYTAVGSSIRYDLMPRI
jgi:hypothetical protein